MGSDRAKFCNLCEQNIKPRGWATHRKACERNTQKRAHDERVVESIRQRKEDQPFFPGDDGDLEYREFEVDDIKVVHHPKSGIPTKVHVFGDFKRHPAHHSSWSAPEPDAQPWRPFKSRLEFDIAEIALEAALNNAQTDRLLDICRRCARQSEKFTFQHHKDIRAKWDAASQCFTKDVVLIPFADKSWDFDVYYRDLWGWATDLLNDPYLFPHFHFDAQHLSKFNGQSFEHFVDEPFMAQNFWDAQSQLLPDAKPLAFILYADKTKLSSFGSAKGYPVVTRLANLPTDIRNGQGMGGGYIVGWLPVVKEDKQHSGKPAWANFKATVWHKSSERILSLLATKSNMGQWFECLDRVQRWFFPLILILSSDFEEQSTMSLTRGVRALWPCPVCLVPHDKLSDTSHCYPRRTSCDSQAILATARAKDTAEEREENAFWTMKSTDVHRALSWDKLHFHSGGEWSDHLWVELQKYINGLGQDKTSQVDKNYQAFPRWRDQKHPNQVMNISFTDNSVHEDISKMMIYATHDILTERDCPLGYLLLRCVRLYLELDMYASLEVHTAETISSGHHTHRMFSAILHLTRTEKNWNYPKLHMDLHIFDDVEAKGATRNYNTKPNEKMHGSLKDSYLLRTNFRDVAEQILQINQWQVVADRIRRRLYEYDEHQRQLHEEDLLEEEDFIANVVERPISTGGSFHVKLGSKQPSETFDAIEKAHQDDQAFGNFRIKLNDFLNVLLPSSNIPLPDSKQDKVIIGRLLFLFECLIQDHKFPLALIHPFDDRDLNLFRVRARRRAEAQFFSVRSIIRGALLVPDGPSDYLVVDTADTDMFLRMKMMHLEAGHIVRV
ncbi:uncharacterized protein EDB91DRAFT_1237102 [Suillus paluster]|uniref:uncharacterized protein n=1 Tax=Suillus paluster TaxID=48578 RepID=UPI001B8861AD|nr:uncharacterized protein EDB91DRAFT_1237102 [Suillus paluster]KAG1741895.1 hypothetical protein EDB91DRAFT_1237102 [Suillus paluster]